MDIRDTDPEKPVPRDLANGKPQPNNGDSEGHGSAFIAEHAGSVLPLESSENATCEEGPKPLTNGKPSDLGGDPPLAGSEVAVYDYNDASGALCYEAAEFEIGADHPEGPERMTRYCRRGKRGVRIWGLGDVEPVPYRLPEIVNAREQGDTILLTESERAVELLCGGGFAATTIPGGLTHWRPTFAERFRDAEIVLLSEKEGNQLDVVAASLYGIAGQVRVADLLKRAEDPSLEEWLSEQPNEVLRKVVTSARPWSPGSGGDEEEPGRSHSGDRPQRDVLIGYSDDMELFHDQEDRAFASFEIDGTWHTAAISSSQVTDYLRRRYYEEEGGSPNAQALTDARSTLRTQARFEGDERPVGTRVAGIDDRIFIDLANDRREIIKITPAGWSVIGPRETPVRFVRSANMQALPHPEPGGSLGDLRRHVPVLEEDLPLLYAFLLQALRPHGPYPLLALVGPHGSGKTITARLLRRLVDPARMEVATRPRSERDLAIAADQGWLLTFDNLSSLSTQLSDAFCRLSTGGGFVTRSLYTNRELEYFWSQRPVILTGIEDLARRGDLISRTLTLRLRSIPSGKRQTESELFAAFDRDRPRLLGALCEALSTALGRIGTIDHQPTTRLADFERLGVAAEPAFPQVPGTFLDRYLTYRENAREDAVAHDIVASLIVELVKEEGPWTGTNSQLLDDLRQYLPDSDRPPSGYPDSHQAMTARLQRIESDLDAVGIERVDDPRKRSREFTLRRIDQ